MTDYDTLLANLEERIKAAEEMSEADSELLLLFNHRMKLLDSVYSKPRREKLLRHCTRMAEHVGGLADALEDREATETLVEWIVDYFENEGTKHSYRNALRMFGKRVTDGDDIPESIEWVPSGMSSSHNPVPDPAEMLEWDADVQPMIKEARNARDAALVAVAFDAGARSGELEALTVGDVSDHRHGKRILVDGKTGERSVSLIPSVPYLQRWLADHPAPDDPDAPLWSKLTEPEPLSYRAFLDIFKMLGERAGIEKPVTPTNFRKSNATWLARQGMNQPYIEDRQGRVRNSDATAHYVAKFGGEADDEYARLHGKDVESDTLEVAAPRECPRCDADNPPDREKCWRCTHVLDHPADEAVQADERDLRTAVLQLAKQNPDLLDDVENARTLVDLFEQHPDLYEDAREFSEALADG